MREGDAGRFCTTRGRGEMMQKRIYLCSKCGRPIEGEHVYIKTRRHTEIHIHYGCMRGGQAREQQAEKGIEPA